MPADVRIYTDGAARGNPGPSASGFMAEMEGGDIFELEESNGKATNNYAEYRAIVMALTWCGNQLKRPESLAVELYSDSELVVKQINGLYKVKDRKLKALNTEVQGLIMQFKIVVFKNVRRSNPEIARVDKRLNLLLDGAEPAGNV
ncbi:MAG TPA: ribonuclease HI family protein [Candidatus Acidoferrales bacterium]|nr:ribonuclease HI family protein [Candidatus Acidoferrales bacterium]